jgi:hypothetical protein
MHVNNGNLRTVNGAGLNHRRLSPSQRLSMAVDHQTGLLTLTPSRKQTCELFNVPPAKLRKELERRAKTNGSLSDEAIHLVTVWAALSPADREAAFQEIGAAEVWDVLAKIVT